jgi:hypothetical protein
MPARLLNKEITAISLFDKVRCATFLVWRAPPAMLENAAAFLPALLSWLYLLPAEAKNTAGALTTLAQLTLPSA